MSELDDLVIDHRRRALRRQHAANQPGVSLDVKTTLLLDGILHALLAIHAQPTPDIHIEVQAPGGGSGGLKLPDGVSLDDLPQVTALAGDTVVEVPGGSVAVLPGEDPAEVAARYMHEEDVQRADEANAKADSQTPGDLVPSSRTAKKATAPRKRAARKTTTSKGASA